MRFVEVAALLVLMLIYPSIFCPGIRLKVVLRVFNSTSLNVLTLYHIQLFGLSYLIMALTLPLFHFCPISIPIFHVVFGILAALALFGLLRMAYSKVTLLVLLSLIVFYVPLCISSVRSMTSLFTLLLMILLLFLHLGIHYFMLMGSSRPLALPLICALI